jgi:hypothetical protein
MGFKSSKLNPKSKLLINKNNNSKNVKKINLKNQINNIMMILNNGKIP